jgi:predicted extracellular nuclease
MGTAGHIQYTLDGGTAMQYTLTTPIPLTGLSAGSHTVILTLVDNSNVPLVPLAADTVNFTISLTYPAFKTIYQIQYTTLPSGDSPINDSVVSTTGLVTASFASGYFIQAGIGPWNGLYVFDNLHSPAVGDSILLIGTVSEYYNYTELTTVAGLMTVASGKPLPTPLELTTNTVKSEQYEGMLVHLDNALCTKTSTSGWWKVFQGADTCEIGKLMYIYPSPVIGTYYDVTGCVNYTFNLFTVEPRNAADVSVHVGISENTANSNISIYPNPSTSELNISNMEGVNQIRIANLLGETVGNYSVSGQTTAINVNSLPNGIYFVSLLKDNSVMVTRKFIKL